MTTEPREVKKPYELHDRSIHQLYDETPSRTHQSFRDECNINNLMKRYEKTGIIEHLNQHHGEYGDFIGIEDYHSSLNRIQAAMDSFMSLPASIRKDFHNDPASFMSFAQDPKNLDKMVEYGLAEPIRPTPLEEAIGASEKPSDKKSAEKPAATSKAPE